MAQARRSGEHWFDDLPHTTFLIFKGSDSLQSCLPNETRRPLFPDFHGFSFSFQASTCLWSLKPSSTPCVGVKLYILTAVFWDIEGDVFLRLLQMRWWPSTGCGSSWRRTRSTVRSCVASEHKCWRRVFSTTDVSSLSSCRWIFWVQNCSLELHCFSDKWVCCSPCFSPVWTLKTALCMHSALASCLLPISLWCRGVVENFGPGTDGLFQLWLESVSNNLDSVLNGRVLSTLNPRAPPTFCPGSTSPWQYLLSWAWSLLPSIWSPFILLWSSDRFSCSGRLLFQFSTWLQNTANPVLSVSKMHINFAGCLRLSRGTVTCWTPCSSSSQGWQASVWPWSSSTTPLLLLEWSSLLKSFIPTVAGEPIVYSFKHIAAYELIWFTVTHLFAK